MSELTNEEFIEFIESYNHFMLPVSEISKSFDGISFINDDFKLYSLGNIVSMEFSKGNYPKATDAFFYKNENGKMELYFIEFKFINLNYHDILIQKLMDQLKYQSENVENNFDKNFYQNFKKIYNTYENKLLTNIIFKVIESLNIALPELYEIYCKEHEIPVKDIRQYLRDIDKKFVLFSKVNPKSKSRLQNDNNYLNSRLEKLVRGNVIDDYQIYSSVDFKIFLKLNRIL